MRYLLLVFIIAFACSTTATAVDVAISTQAGWWSQAAADREMQEIADNVTAVLVELFTPAEQAALATWVTEHTGDGISDLLIICGQFPDTIYPSGNAQPDGSLAELFLDDGNTIINTGDWIFYVVNGSGDNGPGGLQNMMDIPGVTVVGEDDTAVTVTTDGHDYTPSLQDFATDRPFHLDTLANDWEVELILAGNATETRADPVIVRNTVTGGRIGIFYQTMSQDQDPRGEVISEWINNWYLPKVAGGGIPFARLPDPKDGSFFGQTWGTLSWRPGDFAVSHDVYMGTNFDDVNNGAVDTFVGNVATPMQIVGFVGFPFPDGLVPGATYYWRVDEVNDADPNSPWKGSVWSFSIPPRKAHEPSPADGAEFIRTDATLSWTAGHEAKLHTIFFGDNYDAVADAADGVQSMAATHNPGTLEAGKTYYWRIDEFNPPIVEKGDVWSFTTLPDIPISDPNMLGWWKLDEGVGTTVVDWSGHGNHGTLVGSPDWVAGQSGSALEFTGAGTYVDCGNAEVLNVGVFSVSFWCNIPDTQGYNHMVSKGGHQTTPAVNWGVMMHSDEERILYESFNDTAWPGIRADTTIGQWHHVVATFDGDTMQLYHDGVLAETTSGAGMLLDQSRPFLIGARSDAGAAGAFFTGSIDDVRIYNKVLNQDEIYQAMRGDPKLAWNPSPVNDEIAAINVATNLTWSAGDGASQHDVYFGIDSDAVAGADASDTTGIYRGRQNTTSYTPDGVTMGSGSFYWRIDEVANDGSIVEGGIWTFTVADYALVDDFESYNDIPDGEAGSNLVYVAWIDGFDNPTLNGSTMGYVTGASMETGNVHGGDQSVAFQFNNTTAGVSEVVRTFTPAQDWTAHGIITLSLWFAGDAANVPGQLYVEVNGVRVNYDGDASNLTRAPWQVWNIDLTVIGTNLSNVTSLAIGIQGSGATGTLLLDDIRLYTKARELVTPVQPGASGLVAQYAFEGNANDSAGGHHGTVNGSPLYPVGKSGLAIALDGIDDHVVIGSVGISGVQPRTIAGWAKANVLGTPAWVDVFGFTGPSTDNVHFDIELVGDTSTTTLGWYGLHVHGWEQDIMPIDLEWHHLAASYDGTTVKWYGDGLLVGSEDRTLATSDNVHVGKRQDNDNYFPGQVDDFRIYNRVLSDEEMAGLAGITQPYDKPL